MGKSARAIIIEGDQILVMHRNKHGSQYFTLAGGGAKDTETMEQALVREVREETGLVVTAARLVYTEHHEAPYNDQYIFLCEVAPHGEVAIQLEAEENMMNQININTHQPIWVGIKAFANLPFRTPQLQQALLQAFKKGFPGEPVQLS